MLPYGGPGWTRTNAVSFVGDLQSLALAARHTDPYIKTLNPIQAIYGAYGGN